MVWGVIYHPEVQDDLDSIGTAEARRIFKVTEDRIINGSPDKTGNPFPGFIPTDRITQCIQRLFHATAFLRLLRNKPHVFLIPLLSTWECMQWARGCARDEISNPILAAQSAKIQYHCAFWPSRARQHIQEGLCFSFAVALHSLIFVCKNCCWLLRPGCRKSRK